MQAINDKPTNKIQKDKTMPKDIKQIHKRINVETRKKEMRRWAERIWVQHSHRKGLKLTRKCVSLLRGDAARPAIVLFRFGWNWGVSYISLYAAQANVRGATALPTGESHRLSVWHHDGGERWGASHNRRLRGESERMHSSTECYMSLFVTWFTSGAWEILLTLPQWIFYLGSTFLSLPV